MTFSNVISASHQLCQSGAWPDSDCVCTPVWNTSKNYKMTRRCQKWEVTRGCLGCSKPQVTLQSSCRFLEVLNQLGWFVPRPSVNGAIDADGEIQNGGPEPKIVATVHSWQFSMCCCQFSRVMSHRAKMVQRYGMVPTSSWKVSSAGEV